MIKQYEEHSCNVRLLLSKSGYPVNISAGFSSNALLVVRSILRTNVGAEPVTTNSRPHGGEMCKHAVKKTALQMKNCQAVSVKENVH